MPKKSKRQKTLIKNLLNVNCVSLLPAELNDSKFNNQNNNTNENDLKLVENIECNILIKIIKIIIYLIIIITVHSVTKNTDRSSSNTNYDNSVSVITNVIAKRWRGRPKSITVVKKSVIVEIDLKKELTRLNNLELQTMNDISKVFLN